MHLAHYIDVAHGLAAIVALAHLDGLQAGLVDDGQDLGPAARRAARTDPNPVAGLTELDLGRMQARGGLGVGSGRPPAGGAEVMAVVYQPGLQTVEVRQGDNRGQAVRHVNVVREVKRLGDWTGRPVLFVLPPDSASEDNVVVLVQAKTDRRILSAARRAEPARD